MVWPPATMSCLVLPAPHVHAAPYSSHISIHHICTTPHRAITRAASRAATSTPQCASTLHVHRVHRYDATYYRHACRCRVTRYPYCEYAHRMRHVTQMSTHKPTRTHCRKTLTSVPPNHAAHIQCACYAHARAHVRTCTFTRSITAYAQVRAQTHVHAYATLNATTYVHTHTHIRPPQQHGTHHVCGTPRIHAHDVHVYTVCT